MATIILVASFLFTNQVAIAEIQTFTKEYTYEAGELDSKVTSRFNALEQAKRLLLEELGVFLTSQTEVVNSALTKDQITSITAGIVSAVVMDEKWDGHNYWLKAKIEADPSVVQQAIEVIRGDTKKTKELEGAQKRVEQLTKDLEAVKKDLASTPQERQKRYTKIVNQKQSVDLVTTFLNLFNEKKSFAENKEALDAINKAIELDPEYLVPYVMRAMLYGEVAKDYQRGIEDMTTAIKYFAPGPNNPYENTAMLYEGRGLYYLRQNKVSPAASDFMAALEVDPNGILMPLGMFKDTDIEIFVKKLPKDYRSYVLRARYNSHFISGSDDSNNSDKNYKLKKYKAYDSAISDIKKALKLNNKNHIAYYILTEAHRYKARWYDAGHINEIDTVNHNAIVKAATNGLNLSTSKEWKNRFLGLRALEYLTMKQYKQAITDYNSLLLLYPDYAGTYHDRAIAYKELGLFDNALSDISRAIGMKHDRINWPQSAYEIRALIYEAMGNYKEAVEDYSSAFNIWEKAFGAFNKENKLGSGVAFGILEKRANARRKIGDFTKAIEDYRLAIEWMKEFHSSMVYEQIGDTYMDLEKPEEAIAEYDKAISRNSESDLNKNRLDKTDSLASEYYIRKAQAYGKLDKVDKAIESYKQALAAIDDLPPFKEEIYRDMGMLYQGLGIKLEALKCYREAVMAAEYRGAAEFFTYTLLAPMELDYGNKKEAFEVFNKLIRFYPKSTGAYVARGSANLSLGNYSEAIADFNISVEIAPTNSYAYFNRAVAHIRLGQNEKGTDDLRISAKLGNKDAQNTLKENNLEW
jgi:tetratricopeptide (TPR) repeat protein